MRKKIVDFFNNRGKEGNKSVCIIPAAEASPRANLKHFAVNKQKKNLENLENLFETAK